MTQSIETLAREYLEAVGKKDLRKVEQLLAPDVVFVGPVTTYHGVGEVLAAFRNIGAVHVRNEVRRVFVDGDEACVVYDFVTDTVGAVPTIEWLRVERGRIASVKLYYDQVPWQTLRQELAKRAAQPSA